MNKSTARNAEPESLHSIIAGLPDPRVERTRFHRMDDMHIISICAILCGAESFEDMALFGRTKAPWLRTFFELLHGIPSHDTFNRLLSALAPESFLEAFMRWTQSLRSAVADEVVAIDGKALRRAIDAGQSPKVIVSAWAASNRLVLGQRRVDDKSNEPSEAR